MTLRLAKQLVYGALYLIIVVGIIAGFYFAFGRSAAASCFDGKQDQGETGVDCGGPCVAICTTSALPNVSLVGDVQVFNPTPQHYTLLAQVANTNATFGAQLMTYQFNLYDASGNLIQSVPGQSFIYGGEVKYLVAPNISVATAVDHASFVVQPPTWVPSATLGAAPQFANPLSVTDSTLTSSTITVDGRLTDGDVSSFTNVLIVAIFYDTYGIPVGASQTVLDGIAPGQTANFSVMYPAASDIVPALTKAYAYASR